jgi:hypothetical protein
LSVCCACTNHCPWPDVIALTDKSGSAFSMSFTCNVVRAEWQGPPFGTSQTRHTQVYTCAHATDTKRFTRICMSRTPSGYMSHHPHTKSHMKRRPETKSFSRRSLSHTNAFASCQRLEAHRSSHQHHKSNHTFIGSVARGQATWSNPPCVGCVSGMHRRTCCSISGYGCALYMYPSDSPLKKLRPHGVIDKRRATCDQV